MIQLRTNWPTLLPCQVTSPEAKVTLHREFPPAEVAVDGTDISFNVMKGFTIHRPRPHHAGAMYCVASLGGLRQSSTKYMLIYVHCGWKGDRKSMLTAASQLLLGSVYHLGQSFTFSLCHQTQWLLQLQSSRPLQAQWL